MFAVALALTIDVIPALFGPRRLHSRVSRSHGAETIDRSALRRSRTSRCAFIALRARHCVGIDSGDYTPLQTARKHD